MKPSLLALTVAASAFFATGCSHPPEGPVDITGTSTKYIVKGQYAPIALDDVQSLGIENGKLVVHGSASNQTIDVPASADAAKPDPHWALTTESDASGKHFIVFTQDMSTDDISIELPTMNADLHYGTLTGPNGSDVMLFAWGEKSHCYWGYVTIVPKAGS
jgi:hypothetical protein